MNDKHELEYSRFKIKFRTVDHLLDERAAHGGIEGGQKQKKLLGYHRSLNGRKDSRPVKFQSCVF